MMNTSSTQSLSELLTALGPVLATLNKPQRITTTTIKQTKTKRRRLGLRSRDDSVPLKPLKQTTVDEEYDPEHPSYDDPGTTTMVVVKHTDMVIKCERYWKKRLKQRDARHKAELKALERSFESKIRSLQAMHRRSK
jgi:hypothetical protein